METKTVAISPVANPALNRLYPLWNLVGMGGRPGQDKPAGGSHHCGGQNPDNGVVIGENPWPLPETKGPQGGAKKARCKCLPKGSPCSGNRGIPPDRWARC